MPRRPGRRRKRHLDAAGAIAGRLSPSSRSPEGSRVQPARDEKPEQEAVGQSADFHCRVLAGKQLVTNFSNLPRENEKGMEKH